MKLHALHGFFGNSQDWIQLFETHPLKKNLMCVELHQPRFFNLSLREWAVMFNHEMALSLEKKVLMGYSMGGRLALHALIQKPEIWTAAVIISAHPGLSSVKCIEDRKKIDEMWQERFKKENWTELVNEWNKNAIFQHDAFQFIRKEEDFNREALAQALQQWSLATQSNLLLQIAKIPIPILWIAGEKDRNISCIKNLTLMHPLSRIWIESGAGHRVPWTHPDHFFSHITQFIGEL